MNVAETLIAARAKIARFDNWVVGGLAFLNPQMAEVDPWTPGAKCFCLVGAIASVFPSSHLGGTHCRIDAYTLVSDSEAGQLLAAVIAGQKRNIEGTLEFLSDGNGLFGGCAVYEIIYDFNDTPGPGTVKRSPQHHADVLAVFDEAIEHARAADI